LKWKSDEAKEMLDLGANVDWDCVRYDVEGVYIDILDVCEARRVDREMEEEASQLRHGEYSIVLSFTGITMPDILRSAATLSSRNASTRICALLIVSVKLALLGVRRYFDLHTVY
jgi:hypothetical protein